MPRKSILAGTLLVIGAAAGVATYYAGGDSESSGSMTIPQATPPQLAAAGLDKLPLAPESTRVDLVEPTFSDPTDVTNPLFPISELHSAILNGNVDGKSFRVETTLLPETRIIQWPPGRQVETLVSQYVAYLDGRIEEVALDFYAQADDGSVWYFGEDVFNYEDGAIADLEGTWLAGKEGPAAMIMPADPRPGDVYLPENVPGLVFEQVTVKPLRETVAGPRGPIAGAIVAEELHQDGMLEEKIFAPGYGEFFTGSGGDVEALALAIPTDELSGPPAAELRTLSDSADKIFEQARAKEWTAASATMRTIGEAWQVVRAEGVPPRLGPPMNQALQALARSVAARDSTEAGVAAIDVAQSGLDLQLRHRPPAEIDRARFGLWVRQILVDAARNDSAEVAGDLATLEWIRDRIAPTLDVVDLTLVDAQLVKLRGNVTDDDVPGAATSAARLRAMLARL